MGTTLTCLLFCLLQTVTLVRSSTLQYLTPSPIASVTDLIQRTESLLARQYGQQSKELQFFEALITEYKNGNSSAYSQSNELLSQKIGDVYGQEKQQQHEALLKKEVTDVVTDGEEVTRAAISFMQIAFGHVHGASQQVVAPLEKSFPHFQELVAQFGSSKNDVPCQSPSDCAKLEKLINLCGIVKKGANSAYEIFGLATHVLSNVQSLLCACIFIGPVHVCALRNFPYTCVFPYQVFSTFVTASSSVWELVKGLNSICRVYGDPGILSAIA